MTSNFNWDNFEDADSTTAFDWDKYEDAPKNEKVSKSRSLASAFPAGLLEGVNELSSMNLKMPTSPISPKLGKRMIEKFLPTKEETEEDFLKRFGKLTPYVIAGPESLISKGSQAALGALAGQIAKEEGYGEMAQDLTEMGVMGLYSLARMGVSKASSALKKVTEKYAKSPKGKIIFGGGEPPSPPPGSPPGGFSVGQDLPSGSKSFNLAEQALEELKQPTIEKPKAAIEFPSVKTEQTKPLVGRAKILENKATSSVSSDKFYNEKHGGIDISGRVKNNAKLDKIPVTKNYKAAEKIYQKESDIFPELVKEVDGLIESLGQSAKLNTGEKAVYDQLNALKDLLGNNITGLKQVNLGRLVKTADSMSGLANYEMPYTGPKGILKSVVKKLNDSVVSSLEKKGLNANAMRKADKSFSEWASLYLNDEISPFLEKGNLNPEAKFRKAVSDEATYRAVRQALGKKGEKSVGRLEREIVDERLKKYFKDADKIHSPEFETDIRNLEGLIGKEKTLKIKNLMKKEPIRPKTMAREDFRKKAELAEKRLKTKKITSATQEKASDYLGKTPEKIEEMLNSRSGIRKLRTDLKGNPELFDKLAEEKTVEILKGGVVSGERITGKTMFDSLRNKKNYDILTEIYGENTINQALIDAKVAYNKDMRIDKLIRLGKMGASAIGATKFIKALSTIF